MLIQYLYQDEPDVARWQSGYVTAGGRAKLSHRGRRCCRSRRCPARGVRTVLWGQVRRARAAALRAAAVPGRRAGARSAGSRRRRSRGFLSRTVRAGKGATFRLWYPSGDVASPLLRGQLSRPSPGCAARGTRAGPPGPRRSCAAPRSGAPSRGRRAGRGRASSRAAPRAGLRSQARARTRSTAASRSAATSCTSPIRSAVAASKRSPVTK